MNNPTNIDRFDEILRLLYLDRVKAMDAGQIEQELSNLLSSNKEVISPSREEVMISGLTALMQQPSFGQLIEHVMKERKYDEKLLVEKTGLTTAIINGLRKDAIYPNNVPIQLFKKLAVTLELSYTTVRTAALKTFGQLKHQVTLNDVVAFGFVPAFRKGYEQIGSGPARKENDADGNELFENEDALNKYLNRLEELMTE